jgi:hypothetical protein
LSFAENPFPCSEIVATELPAIPETFHDPEIIEGDTGPWHSFEVDNHHIAIILLFV